MSSDLKRFYRRPGNQLIIWIAIGIGIGAALGSVATGLAIGIAIGLALEMRGRNLPQDSSAEGEDEQ